MEKILLRFDFENTEHFWAYLDDYGNGGYYARRRYNGLLRPKKEDR